jgi:hypothetical protein
MHATLGFPIVLLAHAVTTFAAPTPLFEGLTDLIFGLKDSGAESINVTNVDPLVVPARFARVAYCSTESVLDLSCGEPCKALGDVEILFAGGDDKATPRFYVAHDKPGQTIVVSHQGTNTKSLCVVVFFTYKSLTNPTDQGLHSSMTLCSRGRPQIQTASKTFLARPLFMMDSTLHSNGPRIL